jgi:hypothetical protein
VHTAISGLLSSMAANTARTRPLSAATRTPAGFCRAAPQHSALCRCRRRARDDVPSTPCPARAAARHTPRAQTAPRPAAAQTARTRRRPPGTQGRAASRRANRGGGQRVSTDPRDTACVRTRVNCSMMTMCTSTSSDASVSTTSDSRPLSRTHSSRAPLCAAMWKAASNARKRMLSSSSCAQRSSSLANRGAYRPNKSACSET